MNIRIISSSGSRTRQGSSKERPRWLYRGNGEFATAGAILARKSWNFRESEARRDFIKNFWLVPSLGNVDNVRTFWEIYRHGLLHQAALKTKAGIIQAALHNAAQDFEVGYDAKGWVFSVSPAKFSDRVIEIIENDFPTFEGHSSATHALAQISKDSGTSGYRIS